MITSAHNPKIQAVCKLQTQAKARRDAQAFIVEGVRLTEEVLQADWPVLYAFYTPDLSDRGRAVVDGFARQGAMVEMVTPEVMKAASDTETPQGLLAVLALQPLPLPSVPDFLLIPDGVRDPGNLGTILRTAAAAGVHAVLLPPGSTDPYAPKVVRAAMGAHFRLPVHSLGWAEITALLKPSVPAVRPRIYLADATSGLAYTRVDFRAPLALVVGGEAQGAGADAASLADEHVHIPMPGGIESLNAAIAAAILVFEVVRQRSEE